MSKQGLQDATKNVRIYGTISAASSPSSVRFPSRPPRRDASRESLSRASCPPCLLVSTPPRSGSSLTLSLAPSRVSRRARVVLTSSSPQNPAVARLPVAHLPPLLAPSSTLPPALPISPSPRPPSSLSPSPICAPHSASGRGPHHHRSGAHSGAIAPTFAGTTLMLH